MKSRLFIMGLIIAVFIPTLVYAVSWLTPKNLDNGWKSVEWYATPNSSGAASATTTTSIQGELRNILWVPVDTTVTGTNTGTLTVNSGWAKPSNSGVSTFTSGDVYFTHTFGSSTAAELYKDTAELVNYGNPVFNVTGSLDSNGEPAPFRFIFLFAPEPDALPAE